MQSLKLAAALVVQRSARALQHERAARAARETASLKLAKLRGVTFVNQYVVIKYLGKGANGRVFLCLDMCDTRLYAVKARGPRGLGAFQWKKKLSPNASRRWRWWTRLGCHVQPAGLRAPRMCSGGPDAGALGVYMPEFLALPASAHSSACMRTSWGAEPMQSADHGKRAIRTRAP